MGGGGTIFLTNPCLGFDYAVDDEGLWASFHIQFLLADIDVNMYIYMYVVSNNRHMVILNTTRPGITP